MKCTEFRLGHPLQELPDVETQKAHNALLALILETIVRDQMFKIEK